MTKPKLLLIIGSIIAFVAATISAFISSFAYIIISAEWANFYIPTAPHLVSYPVFTLGLHEFTLKLLITAFGGFLGILSFIEKKTAVPFLSFSGLTISTIGFLIPATSTNNSSNLLIENIQWVGSIVALIGVLLMFLGFTLTSNRIPRYSLIVIPILLCAYFVAPILILTDNLPFFISIQANITTSTILGVLILGGHLIIIWASIIGLRFPEHIQNSHQKNSI